jgi:integral membrane sensor domain MASE1
MSRKAVIILSVIVSAVIAQTAIIASGYQFEIFPAAVVSFFVMTAMVAAIITPAALLIHMSYFKDSQKFSEMTVRRMFFAPLSSAAALISLYYEIPLYITLPIAIILAIPIVLLVHRKFNQQP